MDEFAREWTYRSPLKTVTYPKGHTESLPADVRKAAEADGVLAEKFEHHLELKPAKTRTKKPE